MLLLRLVPLKRFSLALQTSPVQQKKLEMQAKQVYFLTIQGISLISF